MEIGFKEIELLKLSDVRHTVRHTVQHTVRRTTIRIARILYGSAPPSHKVPEGMQGVQAPQSQGRSACIHT